MVTEVDMSKVRGFAVFRRKFLWYEGRLIVVSATHYTHCDDENCEGAAAIDAVVRARSFTRLGVASKMVEWILRERLLAEASDRARAASEALGG